MEESKRIMGLTQKEVAFIGRMLHAVLMHLEKEETFVRLKNEEKTEGRFYVRYVTNEKMQIGIDETEFSTLLKMKNDFV